MKNLEKKQTNKIETFPEISINPVEEFASKRTPTFESSVVDKSTNEVVGKITFKLRHEAKEIIVEHVSINKSKQGYGVSLYKTLQNLYPEYQLVSSGQMKAKDDEHQEKPNAIYLWEKLVRLGDAEEDGKGGYRMKKNEQENIPSILKIGGSFRIEDKDFVVEDVSNAADLAKQFDLVVKREVPVYYLDGVYRQQASYHPELDCILIFKNTREDSVKHELVHAIEFPQIKTQELLDFYEKAKVAITEDSFGGDFVTFNFTKNVSEFIADGYSKTPFINALKKENLYDDFIKLTKYIFE